MSRYRYVLIDVFTDRPFGGNPLAVLPDAQGIDAKTMQAIAREFNLSETTFVLPPTEKSADYHVRIFTPAAELPMAGHPTVGTTFVLAQERHPAGTQPTTMLLEEGVGIISVTLDWNSSPAPGITMQQLRPSFGPRFENVNVVASILSLEPDDIISDVPIEVVSCGVPFLIVPIKTLQAIQRISFQQSLWQQELAHLPGILVFTRQTQTPDAAVHCRVFAPALGIAEDPATGAANGPMGCYLVRYGLVPTNTQNISIVSEQGFEMGRPSLMYITVEYIDRDIHRVTVGGHCIFMGEGVLDIPSSEEDR
ncbi:MAG TPA: PhzF family phenazine biosynthesis protein [Ktedonobacter sp.]|nr:PhzF family phenazine biosynthesis protein [Ktedonobacter sp.]